MKTIPGLVLILLLCGCIYETPLIVEAVIPVNQSLTGLWQEIPKDGKAEDPDDRLVILPFSATEYIAVLSPGNDALYFRAYPVRLKDMELIQLEWLGVDKEKNEPYLVCRQTLADGVLTIETLNGELVSPEIKDPASLRKALLENRSNPELEE